jgi:hypothetical protein
MILALDFSIQAQCERWSLQATEQMLVEDSIAARPPLKR